MDIKKLVCLVLEDDECYTNLRKEFMSLNNENQLSVYLILVSSWIVKDIKDSFCSEPEELAKGKYTIRYIQNLILTEINKLLSVCNQKELRLRLITAQQSLMLSSNEYQLICCMCYVDINIALDILITNIINMLLESFTMKINNFSKLEQTLIIYEFQLYQLHHLEEQKDGDIL